MAWWSGGRGWGGVPQECGLGCRLWWLVVGVVSCGMRWWGLLWCGVLWHGVVWCGVVWCIYPVSALEPFSTPFRGLSLLSFLPLTGGQLWHKHTHKALTQMNAV